MAMTMQSEAQRELAQYTCENNGNQSSDTRNVKPMCKLNCLKVAPLLQQPCQRKTTLMLVRLAQITSLRNSHFIYRSIVWEACHTKNNVNCIN